jgi:hypothetical protein
MGQSARDKFYQRTEAAPVAARGFLESVAKPKEAGEPEISDIRLFKEDWFNSARPFMRTVGVAKIT